MSEVLPVLDPLHIRPTRTHLFSASAGQHDLAALRPLIEGSALDAFVPAFDFTDVTSVSGSYLRATIGWCLACGRMHTEGVKRSDFSDAWALRPLAVYPVVVGGSREIIEEIHDFLAHRDLACMLISSTAPPPYPRTEILGRLDEFLVETLQKIASAGTATAQELMEGSSERITVSGWSNRLVALLANRLVARKKEGKTWRYEALGRENRLWG